jgi:hypothetical protein
VALGWLTSRTSLGDMGRVLRVHDCLTLPDVLGVLAPEACSLHWSVLDLGEVVPGEGWDMRVPYR